mmetsp:Transcript_18704/g.38943  ORF Transcript_18704/g.38943 Transcript_18704/m.38943 type:complete len:227 (-) Transcript_18704:885-1565(-)
MPDLLRGLALLLRALRRRQRLDIWVVLLVDEGNELVIIDLPITRGVHLPDHLLDVGALEGVAQDRPQVLSRDLASVVDVEARKRLAQNVFVSLDAAHQRGSEELCVLYLLVVVCVQALKERPGLVATDAKLLFEDLLQLLVRDGAVLLCVQQQELLAQLGNVVGRQGPRHHREHGAAEVGSVRETPKALENGAVDARDHGMSPALDPRMIQCTRRSQPHGGIFDQQ